MSRLVVSRVFFFLLLDLNTVLLTNQKNYSGAITYPIQVTVNVHYWIGALIDMQC